MTIEIWAVIDSEGELESTVTTSATYDEMAARVKPGRAVKALSECNDRQLATYWGWVVMHRRRLDGAAQS